MRLCFNSDLHGVQLVVGVQRLLLRGASIMAVHPLGRLPCRVILATTGWISRILEALKLEGNFFFLLIALVTCFKWLKRILDMIMKMGAGINT